jgi:hypothetical protein
MNVFSNEIKGGETAATVYGVIATIMGSETVEKP